MIANIVVVENSGSVTNHNQVETVYRNRFPMAAINLYFASHTLLSQKLTSFHRATANTTNLSDVLRIHLPK